jgi:hemerythrin-like metal-binding protein
VQEPHTVERTLGIAPLDEQHDALLGLINAFQLAILGHRPLEEIRTIAETALGALRAHFRYEEALCEQSGFPGAAEHNFQHQHLLLNATSLTEDALESRHSPDVINENLEILRGLFFSHVGRDDRALVEHLAARGAEPDSTPLG